MEKTFEILSERKTEIESYIELIKELETALLNGIPIIDSAGHTFKISPLQQKILSAGVFLHLYNMVEATICNLIQDVELIASAGCESAASLSDQMRRQWVKSMASTHKDLTPENRLNKVMDLCMHFTDALPLKLEIVKGGGGNWDDTEIENLANSIGVMLNIPNKTYSDVKRPLRNEKGALKVVKDLRNGLAHGSLSFAECGDGHSANDLESLYFIVSKYMDAIVRAFNEYVVAKSYLRKTELVTET